MPNAARRMPLPAGPRRIVVSSSAFTRTDKSLRPAIDSIGTVRAAETRCASVTSCRAYSGASDRAQHRIVTGALAFEAELPPRDPHERVEPVEGADCAGGNLHDPVAALNVLQLVE